MDGTDGSAWSRIDDFDGAAALIDAVLDLDPDDEYTRSELSEVADVDYKTLYLEGTVQAVVELGLLERAGDDPEQAFRAATDRPAFEAARAFARAVDAEDRERVSSQ